MNPVEVHAAGEAGIFFVLPFLLYAAELIAVRIKQNGAYASCAGVDRQQVLCFHRCVPLFISVSRIQTA